LEKLERRDQAIRVYRELTARFGQDPTAAEAGKRLDRLASPQAARDN
jgi:hypothetical protein